METKKASKTIKKKKRQAFLEGTDKQKACSSSGVLIFVEDGYWLELTRESKVGLVRGWESSEWRKREKARKREKEKKKKGLKCKSREISESHNYYWYYSSKASATVSFLSLSFFPSDSKWRKGKKFHSYRET